MPLRPGRARLPAGPERRPDCLTPAQTGRRAARIYRGLVITEGGEARFSYPGYSPGAEAEPGSWGVWITGPSTDQLHQALIFGFATGFWARFRLRRPGYDVLGLDLQTAPVDAAARGRGSSTPPSPDLAPFRDHGGKLIQYHGWNDPAIPARGSIAYYDARAPASWATLSAFYRLYLSPACSTAAAGPDPAAVDWLDLLQAWVEQGQAPGEIAAQTAAADGALGPPTQTLRPYAH